MFKNLLDNLTKTQKIAALVVGQALIIVILVLVIQSFTKEKEHVVIEDSGIAGSNMPEEAESFVADNIWEVIKNNVIDNTQSRVDDVVIREGTYEEEILDDGTVQATFIVDIDSLKQSYTVSTGWSKDGKTVYEVIVNCPPISKMKYPETVCEGMYNNTYSLDTYLPYEFEDGFGYLYIESGEYPETINVEVSSCGYDDYVKKAEEYLANIPVDLSGYEVEYEELPFEECGEGDGDEEWE